MESHHFNNYTMEKKTKFKSLIIEGTKYRTHYNKKFEQRTAWEKPDKKKIISFIPGKIVKINVKNGQTVRKGQVLFILEAMKMKNKVTSLINGNVKNINVKSGEMIAKNHLILEFE